MYTLNFDTAEFLREYWQKKPIAIKNAFNAFEDPISADELAGLAMEDDISSRIVQTQADAWSVVQGPFEDYEKYGEDGWQLLVQAVNHWYPASQPLVEAFRFLPDWRFDDLMVSFATPKGGVGPHIDNYDVFIIQGEGERRWQVGNIGEHQQRGGDKNSPLVDDFDPIIDVVLSKGDVLYIPPGYPHCGETLSLALSYSIGFRAPSQQELLTGLADSLIDNNSGEQRFTSTQEKANKGLVGQQQQQAMMDMLAELATNPSQYQTMLGKLLSQNRFELDLNPIEQAICEADVIEAIEDGASIQRIGGLKVLKLEADTQAHLYVNGEVINVDGIDADIVSLIANEHLFSQQQLSTWVSQPSVMTLLSEFINQGWFYFSE
ncbi:cupin domain-containing protein [Alginatibacterium sediminis]|uniref:Cupin domain-containing protein n=1 Tax=Alginatibacterium sediminis TaxID=2164068 RepID=A0A420EGI9_9ALTE|nr:cupin domain-containing protein [Alginatibacterium sediminis]RKF19798.1 cupin domain-containing protein [Alginatibacterium sediminis]